MQLNKFVTAIQHVGKCFGPTKNESMKYYYEVHILFLIKRDSRNKKRFFFSDHINFLKFI